jgi:hypothetical protein
VPSSDWPAIAEKHHAHPVFRALETGAVFAKSEYSLNSSIVDGYGRIAASAVTPDGSEAVLVADVPLRSDMALAARLGDWSASSASPARSRGCSGDCSREGGHGPRASRAYEPWSTLRSQCARSAQASIEVGSGSHGTQESWVI